MVTEQAAQQVSTGVARKIDDLGRIVLPVELRRMLGIATGDELHVAVNGGDIVLRKIEARCVFCRGSEDLRPYRSKQVCGPCSRALAATQAEGDVVHPPLGDAEVGGDGR